MEYIVIPVANGVFDNVIRVMDPTTMPCSLHLCPSFSFQSYAIFEMVGQTLLSKKFSRIILAFTTGCIEVWESSKNINIGEILW